MSEAIPETPAVDKTPKYVDLRFEFREVIEEEGTEDEYRHFELVRISRSATNHVPEAALEALAERWGQSDYFWTEITHDIISAIDGTPTNYPEE